MVRCCELNPPRLNCCVLRPRPTPHHCRAELAVDEAAEQLAKEQGGQVFTDAVDWADAALLALTARADFEGGPRRRWGGMQRLVLPPCRRPAMLRLPCLCLLGWYSVESLLNKRPYSLCCTSHRCAAERDDVAVSCLQQGGWRAAGGARQQPTHARAWAGNAMAVCSGRQAAWQPPAACLLVAPHHLSTCTCESHCHPRP